MFAIAGGIILAAIVLGAGVLGLSVFAQGELEGEGILKGCGCVIFVLAALAAAYLIF